jgi:hypothetical protein
MGKEFPVSQRNHFIRVKLEQEVNEGARTSYIADVGSAIFATTLTDDGPAAKTPRLNGRMRIRCTCVFYTH